METEAKFKVPGEAAFARLRATEQFGNYERREERTKEVQDRYLDTPGLNFLNNGWSLRLRKGKEGDLLITIKGLERKGLDDGAEAGSIAAREEYETSVRGLTIARWPESEAKQMAKNLAGRQPLHDLVSVDQTRTVSRLYDGERAVAELSLDEVRFKGGETGSGQAEPQYELEAELLPDGTIADVRALSAIFVEEYGLEAQPYSKFEQAIRIADIGVQIAGSGDDGKTTFTKKRRSPTAKATTEVATPTPSLEAPVSEVPLEAAPEKKKSKKQDDSEAVDTPVQALVTPKAKLGRAKKRKRKAEDAIKAAEALILEAKALEAPQAEVVLEDKTESPAVEVAQVEIVETPKPKPQVNSTDSMALAGRKVISHNFKAMLDNEEGARLGEDPEAVHDMRVATRRMRAAMRVFAKYLQSKRAEEVNRGMRDTARALGAVRDLDVLIGNVDSFREGLPTESQMGLASMIEEWRVKRWKARKALVRLLDSKEFSKFKRDMDRFLEEEVAPPDETAGAQPYQVRHVVGSVIMSRYEEVRAFEALRDEPTITQIHALRIVGKYFRYSLEFFRDVLPKDVGAMIKDVTRLQDNLGELHDADVAITLVHDHLEDRGHRYGDGDEGSVESDVPVGLAAYLDKLHSIMDSKQKEYVATWADLQSPEWRKRLAALLVREG